MGHLKEIVKLLLLLMILGLAIGVAIAGYFYLQNQQITSVSLDSYVPDDIAGVRPLEEVTRVKPLSEQDIIDAIVSTKGPITVSGVQYSLGGQIIYPDSLFLDMSDFNKVLAFNTEKKLITVQAGISWREIQQIIDPHNLSIKIMQENNDYTVGGSLSVNAHGRFVKAGPVINSVKSIRIILADGKVYEASPEKNKDLFYGAIGGYGGLGVIVQATLELVDNIAIERSTKSLNYNVFNTYFRDNILNDDSVVLHQAVFYPPNYETLLDISWRKTDKPLTNEQRLQENEQEPWWEPVLIDLKSSSSVLHRFQENLIDPYKYSGHEVVRLNLESSYSLRSDGFFASETSTTVMQEYLIPVHRFEIFAYNMREIFTRHNVNVYKVLISYLAQNHSGLLAGSSEDVYSFKIIYRQEKNEQSQQQVDVWTEELIRASGQANGSYILPYHIHISAEQFYKAFPSASYFFGLKKRIDPANRFKNSFWEQHHLALYTDPLDQPHAH